MKRYILLFFVMILSLSCSNKNQIKKNSLGLPVYDHVVIVMEENKTYEEIIGNKNAPYINDVLVKEGANLTGMYAEEHDSEGNYFWIFSGDNQNVGFLDVIPNSANHKVYPLQASNLAHQLIAKGYTFKGYSENLPFIGDTIGYASGGYARKHVPWVSFGNIPNGTTEKTSVNLQFEQFPSNFDDLPTVSFVIPNQINDMHSGDLSKRVFDGDQWLKDNINNYYQWAKSHKSLLIITFDENSNPAGFTGLTDPASSDTSRKNRIPTIIAGAHIKHGNYSEGKGVDHVNILRTIEAMYGLPKSGHQQEYMLEFGIKDDYIIKDIFE
jgi:phosphatidylinositol-3-phosphatase